MAERGRLPHQQGSGPPQGRAPSQTSAARSAHPSRVASPARSAQQGPAGYPPALGQDPGRIESANSGKRAGNTRMELPPDAYVTGLPKESSAFTLRQNNLNTEGQPAMVEVNQYRMTKFNFDKKIYQYDVSTTRSLARPNLTAVSRLPFRPTQTRRLSS